MAVSSTALIPEHSADERSVDNVDLTSQLAALHAESFAWALVCCDRRREDAEDLLHDVYVSAMENGLRFDGRSTLKTWLFGVIRNKARARIRRERLRALIGFGYVIRPDGPQPAHADAEVLATEQRERTRRALAQLARRQREVLLLVFYHELTIEEAAKVMRVSLGSARVHYHRGKQKLAAVLVGDRS